MGVEGPANAGASAAGSAGHDVEAGAPVPVVDDHSLPSEAAQPQSGLHHRHPHSATAAGNGGLAASDSQAALVVAKGASSSRGDLAACSSEKAGSDAARWVAGSKGGTAAGGAAGLPAHGASRVPWQLRALNAKSK